MKGRPQDRFTTVAGIYARRRPDYPAPLFEWIAREAGLVRGSRVVDVGCGTGIATRLWEKLGCDAVGVDPNEAMLAEAKAAGGVYRRGDAEATGLPGKSADLVAAAQAFHWFDLDKALAEFSRLLKPGAKAAAIWNQREETPLLTRYAALMSEFAEEFDQRPKSADVLAKIEAHPRVLSPVRHFLSHAQSFDREGFFGRAYSASYVALSLKDKPGFDRALGALFDERQRNGRVDFAYRAVAVVFGLKP